MYTFLTVLPRTAYQQSLHRHWQKYDKYERYWPQFQNIGEQAVKRSEVYFSPGETEEQNAATFGYSPRYAEYKYACDRVAGDFRKTSAGDNLSYWHMAQYYDTAPVLDATFVKSNPTHRIFAVTDPDIDKVYIQAYHKISAVRPMSKFSIPNSAG